MAAQTVIELLSVGADSDTAISAVDRPPLTYAGLRALVAETVASLRRLGIGRHDRVAIVLPNGPEMAAAFVAVAASATTAPLNPGYRGEEFRFYLEDLNAKALLVATDSDSAVIEEAHSLGIPVYELNVAEGSPAGSFTISSPGNGADAEDPDYAEPDDIALVLHTSGTTSRPKIVPLSQANICASASHITEILNLTADDRCTNIMPLFHIHGLIGAVLSSLSVGASIYCTPGFNALRVFAWFADSKPSWYSAVPTMHQAILARAGRNAEIVAGLNLRFIRSSSSSLPPQVMAELEETFGCPVIESYGMTEAAHQMASNPLPPATRKPGSVGIAAGPDVMIMDQQNNLLPAGETGEVVIRGPNITKGYENNPTANAEAFIDGWFRTGDQGVLDDEGYLRITGRLKEIINRGGEKISPREVDEVLLDHPAVAQAVTFAYPHDKLGEEVGAAIVLKEGAQASNSDIREFVAQHLADFKVPRKVIFVDEIPKGITGKLQRIGLHEKLGL
ncbi:MAG: acyl--CoA ligase [Alphaproteobacteria bacterium]|nr:acyl--CoA ligase [Alphaproteobacteria bacterium]